MNDLEKIVRVTGGVWRAGAGSVSLESHSDDCIWSDNLAGEYSYTQFIKKRSRLVELYESTPCDIDGNPSFEEWLRAGLKRPDLPQPAHKYQRLMYPTLSQNTTREPIVFDVYDLIDAYGITEPELQHAIKKLLAAGQRGHKSREQDLQDIIDSVERCKQRLAVKSKGE